MFLSLISYHSRFIQSQDWWLSERSIYACRSDFTRHEASGVGGCLTWEEREWKKSFRAKKLSLVWVILILNNIVLYPGFRLVYQFLTTLTNINYSWRYLTWTHSFALRSAFLALAVRVEQQKSSLSNLLRCSVSTVESQWSLMTLSPHCITWLSSNVFFPWIWI